MLLCLFAHIVRAEHKRNNVHKAVFLRRAAQVIRRFFAAAGAYIPAEFKEAVLQLLIAGRFQAAEYAVLIGYLHAVFLRYVFRNQRFNECQRAVAVRQRVEELHRYALFIYYNPKRALPHLLERHIRQRVSLLVPNLGHV